MRSRILAPLVVIAAAAWSDGPGDRHPLECDKTGIRWTTSFDKAREEAKSRNRMLFLVTIAGGTTAAGDW